jgi:hypothetical protein
MQMAICFKLGFGCVQSTQQSEECLKRSFQSAEQLEAEFGSAESLRFRLTRGHDVENWGNADPTPAYHADGILSQAETMHNTALSNLRQVFAESHPLIQEQRIILCQILAYLSRWQQAYELISSTVDDCRKYEIHDITLGRALETKRFICAELCRWQEADLLWIELKNRSKQRSKHVRRDVLTNNRTLESSRQQGSLQLNNHDYPAAEKTFLSYIEIAEAYHGSASDEAIEARALLAITYVLSGNPKKEQSVQEVMVLCDRNDTLYTRSERLRLRILLCRQGTPRIERNKVLRLAVLNLDDCRRQLGLFHRHTLTATEELASLYLRFGRPKEARALREAVVEATKTVYGKDQPVTAFSELSLASSLWLDVRWEAALDLAEQSLKVLRGALGDQHPKVAPWLRRLHKWRRDKYRWDFLGTIFPIRITTFTGRKLNRIAAWMQR